ncbi:hypothetical protein D3C73_388000 [compost metagenome]
MKPIDDYELYDKDPERWIQIGQAAFAADAAEVANDTSRDWPERIRAAAEVQYKQMNGL